MSRLLNQLTQLFSVCTSSFLPQCFEIGVYLQMSDKGIDIGEGLTWVLEHVWRVLSVAICWWFLRFWSKGRHDHRFTRFVLFQLCELVRPLLLTSSLFPGFQDQTNLWSLSQQYFHLVLFTLICISNVWSRFESNQLKSKVMIMTIIQIKQFVLAGIPRGLLYQFRVCF